MLYMYNIYIYIHIYVYVYIYIYVYVYIYIYIYNIYISASPRTSPASYEIYLQYELNGIQLLMCVLFIPLLLFTLQYSFMHSAQFFQELYRVLTQVSHYAPRYATKITKIIETTFRSCVGLMSPQRTKRVCYCSELFR